MLDLEEEEGLKIVQLYAIVAHASSVVSLNLSTFTEDILDQMSSQ